MSPPDEKLAPLEEGESPEEIDDLERLIALAKAYRAGADGFPRDLKRCFECYSAAAALGSAEAKYAVALFFLSGGVVPQDMKEGTVHLRAAADGGVLAAKVYLGNLYELGVHYKADPEKADVWYRSAARTAALKDDPSSKAWARAMAAMGCVRWALELQSDEDVPQEEREAWLKKARTLGYQHKLREERELRASMHDPLPAADDASARANGQAKAKLTAKADANAKPEADATGEAKADAKPRPEAKAKGASKTTWGPGIAAFSYALLFVATGLGAGYAASQGAKLLHARNGTLPLFGHHVELVMPAVVALIGVLPLVLVYRASAFFKGMVGGALFAGLGWALWGTGQVALLGSRTLQTMGFGLAGMLAVLLVAGILGGAKQRGASGD
jgi:hypothetical protein